MNEHAFVANKRQEAKTLQLITERTTERIGERLTGALKFPAQEEIVSMALVHCRECGHEIKADTKQSRCDKCGTFFPFTCAVCDKYLRPPFAVYEDERYVTEDGQPLCQDHYERQCPECKKWFKADENPGYFLCLSCSKTRHEKVAAASVASATRTSVAAPATTSTARGRSSAPAFDNLVFVAICGSAVVGVLFLLFKLLGGG